jgi:hypothetical protein
MEPVEMYRVRAVNQYGRVCKRWTYSSTKTFEAQKKKRDYYKITYNIICEKLDYNTGTWVVIEG